MSTVRIMGAQVPEKLYIPSKRVGSQEDLPDDLGNADASVTGAKVGDGYLVYFGDMRWSQTSTDAIMALCGLSK